MKLNFLPKEEQVIQKIGTINRLLVNSILTCVLLIVVISGYYWQVAEKVRQQQAYRSSLQPIASRLAEKQRQTLQQAEKFNFMEQLMAKRINWTGVLVVISDTRPPKAKLLAIEEQEGKIMLTGQANTQSDVMQWQNRLQKEKLFTAVTSRQVKQTEQQVVSFQLVLEVKNKNGKI